MSKQENYLLLALEDENSFEIFKNTCWHIVFDELKIIKPGSLVALEQVQQADIYLIVI